MRILVTGGAGFIGSHTVDLLLANGMQVVVFDNLLSGDLTHINLAHPQLKFVQQDVLDYSALLVEINRCDAVLHLAAIPSVPKSIENPIESMRVNLQGFLQVVQAIRVLKRPIRLVYASSAAVYGAETPLPCSDERPLSSAVLSPYALEKANVERYAELYAGLFGVKSLGLRYFNVYGPRQDPNSPYAGVISKFIECYRKEKPITIFGDGMQSRDFIYVADIAKANLLALQSSYCGVLNIATGVPETLRNLVSYIELVGGKLAQVDYAAARIGDIAQSYAKIDKAAKELGFRDSTSLEQGIHSLLKIVYN
ncbi:MAG: NAD-dependent epimerase/dehydratase family protein [Gammaproteobacteria bacterium]